MGSITRRAPRRVASTRALSAIAVLGLLSASSARADFDITNTWIISLRDEGGVAGQKLVARHGAGAGGATGAAGIAASWVRRARFR